MHAQLPVAAMNGIEFRNERQLRFAWTSMLVANLPFPPMLMLSMASDWPARAGMVAAMCGGLTALLLLGFRICRSFRWVGPLVIPGGVVLAFLQIFPLPHLIAINLSGEIWSGTRSFLEFSVRGASGGCVVAFLTGAFLLVFAIGAGLFLHLTMFLGSLASARKPVRRPIT